MTVIVGRECDEQTRDVSIVTFDWSEIVGGYNTADTVVRDRRTKRVCLCFRWYSSRLLPTQGWPG